MKRLGKHKLASAILPRYSLRLDQLNHNAALNEWLQANPMAVFADRPALHEHIHKMAPDEPIDYLEFGVFKGDTIRMWSQLNTHPESRFVGFDSFEGLPEDWNPTAKAGLFDVGGIVPQISDSRVSFQKGWFNDTLKPFLAKFEPRSRLVIHNDSDLYSSSLYLLTQLDPIAVPGTVIIFDEIYSALHEFRAMKDYLSAYKRNLKPLGLANDHFGRIAFLYK